MNSANSNDVIDLSDDGDIAEWPANPAIEDFVIIDDEEQPDPPSPQSRSEVPIRNAPPELPKIYASHCRLTSQLAERLGPTGQQVRPGDTVELLANIEQPNIQQGDFLRVFRIIEDLQTGEVTLRGVQFRRNRFLQPMLPRKLNEVFLIVSVDQDDSRPYWEQGMQEVPLASALRKRRLVITDFPFPLLSFRDHVHFETSGHHADRIAEEIAANEVLVCRHIFVYIYAAGDRSRQRRRPHQGMLRFVGAKESDNEGGVLLTGSQPAGLDRNGICISNANERSSRQRQYTFGDGFCGGGGASCAAKLAGLDVKWAFDHDSEACNSMRINFRRATILELEAFDFPPTTLNPHIDILHISPPCQPYSPARNGIEYARDDDANIAALFSVGEIIKVVRPRLVTLEETFGLLTHEKHQAFFQILISMIHREGYSIRWAVLNFKEYGLPQPRKRLIFIAAAPGVPLPEIPKPTHGEPGSGLLPYVTARDAAGRIPRNTANHDLNLTNPLDKPPWNPDQPYTRTILTSNSDCYHWNGKRTFTNRELAALQGFPMSHAFSGSKTKVEKQIGNAVPPICFKLLFQECIKVLRKLDEQDVGRHDDGNIIDLVADEVDEAAGSARTPILLLEDEDIEMTEHGVIVLD